MAKQVVQDSTGRGAPIGFTTHKVRKKETIYGIVKRYDITEEELKRYNKALYAAPLRKKMELRIPKYPANPKNEALVLDPGDYERHIVAPKETRWSIAHTYGIGIDSLLKLNPGLAKNTSYLAVGDSLLLPKLPSSSVADQQVQLFTSYTIPPQMNFYRLEKKFGVKADEIVRLNPEITSRGGLKEGMVIRIPEKTTDLGVVNTDNYIFYEVKPKQNEFRLTRKFGMPWQDLVALNPELKAGLKAGMILKLPKGQKGDFEVKDALILDKISLLDSVDLGYRPRLLYLLPFRSDLWNGLDKEVKANMIAKRNDLKISLGLYSGALVALDSINELGMSVSVKVLDNQLDAAHTKSLLDAERLSEYQVVIGPLDNASLKTTLREAKKYEVPVVAPIRVKGLANEPNLFSTYTEADASGGTCSAICKVNAKAKTF